MSLSSVRTFRWVMTGLGLGAGVLLVATGHTVVGAVIGGLALVRLAFLCSIEARRRRARAAAPPGGAGTDPVLRSLVRGQFEVAAGAIGTNPSEVRIDFANGRSIAEMAAARGVPVQRVVDAVVADAAAKLDRAVADGRTSSTMAARVKTRLPRWATRLVNGHRGELGRRRAGAFG
jgi:hypothetical protein